MATASACAWSSAPPWPREGEHGLHKHASEHADAGPSTSTWLVEQRPGAASRRVACSRSGRGARVASHSGTTEPGKKGKKVAGSRILGARPNSSLLYLTEGYIWTYGEKTDIVKPVN